MALIFATGAARPQAAQPAEQPTESEHRRGPNELEGWTLNYTIPDHPNEKFPMTLVIARNGHILSKFAGDGFVWKWKFVAEGKQVAYESGPMHFGLQCILADVATGKELAKYDCFHGVPHNAPAWLESLEDVD